MTVQRRVIGRDTLVLLMVAAAILGTVCSALFGVVAYCTLARFMDLPVDDTAGRAVLAMSLVMGVQVGILFSLLVRAAAEEFERMAKDLNP